MSSLSDTKWMHSLEETVEGPRLSRTEYFVAYHKELGRLLMTGTLPALVGDALGEFLDVKINGAVIARNRLINFGPDVGFDPLVV